MNQRSDLPIHPRRTLMQRLHNHSLYQRFPLSDRKERWKKINQLFLLLAMPVAFFGLWHIGQRLKNAYVSTNGLINSNNDSSNFIFYLYEWVAKLGMSDLSLSAHLGVGVIYFTTLVFVCFVTCEFWDRLFVRFFHRIKDGGNLLLCFIFALLLPINLPFSYSILGVSFGIVFGKLIFGGNGKYLVSPVLLGVLFLNYSYPSLFEGSLNTFLSGGDAMQSTWNLLTSNGATSLTTTELSWEQVLIGPHNTFVSIATVSAFFSLVGLSILLLLRKEYWGTVFGALLGLMFATLMLNSPDKSSVWQIQWYWHFVVGSFAFCLLFIATDPSILPITRLGTIVYGCIFGFLTIVIRIANPSHPEGTMTALLLASLLVPIIDWIIVMTHRTLLKYKRRRSS